MNENERERFFYARKGNRVYRHEQDYFGYNPQDYDYEEGQAQNAITVEQSIHWGPKWSKPSEILPNLWVGNIDNCATFDGVCINVTEGPPCSNDHCFQITILEKQVDYLRPHAIQARLDEVAEFAINLMKSRPVMLHCWVGMERSPLAATWTVKKLRGWKLGRAWKLVSQKREIAVDRRDWLKNPSGRPIVTYVNTTITQANTATPVLNPVQAAKVEQEIRIGRGESYRGWGIYAPKIGEKEK